jgi:hypothetical protein
MPIRSRRVEDFFESLDLASPRTPDQLTDLVEAVNERLTGSDELRRESLLRWTRLQKKYYEEIRPLALFVQHLFADRKDVVCEPNLEDAKNYDAIIRPSPGERSGAPLYVEFTYAKDGLDEAQRMEVLHDQGHVNLLGRVTRTFTKKTGYRIEVENEVVLHDDTLKGQLGLILKRIDDKAARRYSPAHVLVVVFDDDLGFRTAEELARLRSLIELSTSLPKLTFRTLYLLGSSGRAFLELPLGSRFKVNGDE